MRRTDKPTITDVAQHAKVSIATVSRVINNKNCVKESTERKVYEAIETLGFELPGPKTIENPSKVILVCVPEFNSLFCAPILDGVQAAAEAKGYDFLALQIKQHNASNKDIDSTLSTLPFAGIIFLASLKNKEYLSNLSRKYPMVLCAAESDIMPCVCIDNYQASLKAVKYILSTGREKVGLINYNLDYSYARERERGYCDALAEKSIEINPNWITHISTQDFRLAYSSAMYMLKQKNRPDAIFAVSDAYAISSISAAQQLGLSVPHDVSVLGFDNISLASIVNPALTTVSQPAFQMGYQSFELLFEKIINPEIRNKKVVLETELVLRASTII